MNKHNFSSFASPNMYINYKYDRTVPIQGVLQPERPTLVRGATFWDLYSQDRV
jgi:hypothetical protein